MNVANLSSQECAAIAPQCVAVVPIGSFEQHGPWMPLATDTMIAEAIAHQVDEQVADHSALFPTVWLGSSSEHDDFPGTLSLRLATVLSFYEDLFTSLEKAGFQRAILCNGHGGNVAITTAVCEEWSRAHTLKVSSYYLYNDQVAKLSKELFGVPLSHGGSTELSLIAALRPEVLKTDKTLVANAHPYEGSNRFSYFKTSDFSSDGVIDRNTTLEINAHKGGLLAEVMVNGLLEAVRRMQAL